MNDILSGKMFTDMVQAQYAFWVNFMSYVDMANKTMNEYYKVK